MSLDIQIACPAPAGSMQGNRITALRWARILRGLGHRVRIDAALRGRPAVLVALHARKSAPAVAAFHERFPGRPLVVVLTGTDLYGDLPCGDPAVRASLELATRIVVLQERALRALPARFRAKTWVIHPSAVGPARHPAPAAERFDVLVLAHLRREKDPLRAALAVRSVPRSSRLAVTHLGRALDPAFAVRARAEERANPRYRWIGEEKHAATLRRLAASHLLVLASGIEGASNAVIEAAVLGVGILASRIDANVGLLGARHPGLFQVGDTRGLRALMLRAEREPAFLARLRAASLAVAPRFAPEREREAWRELLLELAGAQRA